MNIQKTSKTKTAVIAVGGNALVINNDKNTFEDQYAAASITCRYIVDMIELGWNIVLTHGNGPQVGFILRQSELASDEVPMTPLEYAGAKTQGFIGYMFEQVLHNELIKRGLKQSVVAMVTQVEVDAKDPAFQHPTKPIGSYMDLEMAEQFKKEKNWSIVEDSGRGYRRVVASPVPKQIIELSAIQNLSEQGYVVIACGGGGVPVIRNGQGHLEGIAAVIDKDFASALLADQLQADLFIIATGVEKVAIDFNQPTQKWLESVSIKELEAYAEQGQFPSGSMGPKISAISQFLTKNPEAKAIITDPQNLALAVQNKAGTHISAK